MKWYKEMALATILSNYIGCDLEHSPKDLSGLVRRNGYHWKSDGKELPWTYELRKTLNDGTEIIVDLWDSKPGKCSKFRINVRPKYETKESHLPIRYETSDWGCDGLNESDDLRMYLGEERWHNISAERQGIDKIFDNVSRAGIKQIYSELVNTVYKEFKK